jgi:hypothetical protein
MLMTLLGIGKVGRLGRQERARLTMLGFQFAGLQNSDFFALLRFRAPETG